MKIIKLIKRNVFIISCLINFIIPHNFAVAQEYDLESYIKQLETRLSELRNGQNQKVSFMAVPLSRFNELNSRLAQNQISNLEAQLATLRKNSKMVSVELQSIEKPGVEDSEIIDIQKQAEFLKSEIEEIFKADSERIPIMSEEEILSRKAFVKSKIDELTVLNKKIEELKSQEKFEAMSNTQKMGYLNRKITALNEEIKSMLDTDSKQRISDWPVSKLERRRAQVEAKIKTLSTLKNQLEEVKKLPVTTATKTEVYNYDKEDYRGGTYQDRIAHYSSVISQKKFDIKKISTANSLSDFSEISVQVALFYSRHASPTEVSGNTKNQIFEDAFKVQKTAEATDMLAVAADESFKTYLSDKAHTYARMQTKFITILKPYAKNELEFFLALNNLKALIYLGEVLSLIGENHPDAKTISAAFVNASEIWNSSVITTMIGKQNLRTFLKVFYPELTTIANSRSLGQLYMEGLRRASLKIDYFDIAKRSYLGLPFRSIAEGLKSKYDYYRSQQLVKNLGKADFTSPEKMCLQYYQK